MSVQKSKRAGLKDGAIHSLCSEEPVGSVKVIYLFFNSSVKNLPHHGSSINYQVLSLVGSNGFFEGGV